MLFVFAALLEYAVVQVIDCHAQQKQIVVVLVATIRRESIPQENGRNANNDEAWRKGTSVRHTKTACKDALVVAWLLG